jgi:hypothetical protein
MAPSLRKAPGMRERSPGVWELIVEAGRDPVTGRRRQVSRIFEGNLRDAKKARALLLVKVGRGRYVGTAVSVDHLFHEWVRELRRKGRSPRAQAVERLPDTRLSLVDVHPGLPVGMARLESGAVGRSALDPEPLPGRADARGRDGVVRRGRRVTPA